MAKTQKVLQSFGSGELSPLMASRIDQAKYDAGCQICENFIPLIYGGVKRRPGTEFIAKQHTASAKGRMIAFERSVTNTYALSFENLRIRVFKGDADGSTNGDRIYETAINVDAITLPSGAVITISTDGSHGYETGDTVKFTSIGGTAELNGNEYVITRVDPDDFTLDGTDGDDFTAFTSGGTAKKVLEIHSPYLTADIPNLKVEHSADVMYITHSDYEQRRLSRTSDTAWTLEVTDIRTGPFREQNTDVNLTIAVAEIGGGGLAVDASVTLTAAGTNNTPFDSSTTAGHLPNESTTAITVFADYNGTVAGTTSVTAASHGLSTGDVVRISGTTSYNGQFTITKIDANDFHVFITFVADDATGEVIDVTAKSQTGALFKVVYASTISNQSGALVTNSLNATHTALEVPKGVGWRFITEGTWGTAANSASVVLERSYDGGSNYEVISTVTSAANNNGLTSGEEEFDDALYRARVSEVGGDASVASTQITLTDTSRTGIVEITAVASTTSATATVRKSLGLSSDTAVAATHRFAEGSWSNKRAWPKTVSISPEDRLVFAGNVSEPLSIWGSRIGDWTDYLSGGDLDDDPYIFVLVGSGQQNEIQWSVPKKALVFGTVGGEHLFSASNDDEAITPTNVQAKLQTTYGSENIRAEIVNQAILFIQRGGLKVREFLFDFKAEAHKADDLTVFAEHITETGIVDIAFQRNLNPILWCVRDDGEIAIMTYERDQNVFSWARIVTDGSFESIDIIYGGVRSEDEIWVTVKRDINGSTARYVERFKPQNWEQKDDAMMVDSALVVTSTSRAAQNIILASDTVRYGKGNYGSSFYGGTFG